MAITIHHHRRLLLETQATSSRTLSSPGSYGNNEANFDTNMVIILAALLCALICALGLNSILRCASRCSRRFALANPDANANANAVAAVRLASSGLKKRALKQIPVASYSMELNIKATDCLICLGEFIDGEKIRVLPRCNHGFHVRCIDTWLLSHNSCPTCRQSLLEQPPPPPEIGSGDADVAVEVVETRQGGNIPAIAAIEEVV